jgi:hypothetical protein|tara:strand:+ start:2750 stop:2962 length:213 start_codon:yes stop_codon:yes gene_type:complete
MIARDLIDEIHATTANVLVPFKTSFGSSAVRVDKKDLEEELLFLTGGNMDMETGLNVQRSKGGLLTLTDA